MKETLDAKSKRNPQYGAGLGKRERMSEAAGSKVPDQLKIKGTN